MDHGAGPPHQRRGLPGMTAGLDQGRAPRQHPVEYQVRWNELLTVLPIYSNEYFDVFNVRVS